MSKCLDCESCFYCNRFVTPRHEHDHFPIPRRAGGVSTVPVCIDCHDLKGGSPLAGRRRSQFSQALPSGGWGSVVFAAAAGFRAAEPSAGDAADHEAGDSCRRDEHLGWFEHEAER